MKAFANFAEFYPFYLSEHSNQISRRLHFTGTFLLFVILAFVINTLQWTWLWLLPVVGYGFAWAGHFFFEKNRPATFEHPIYSLMGDFVMFKDIFVGKIKF